MKALLSGMPECKFGLNDKLTMEKEVNASSSVLTKSSSVELDDCNFHRFASYCALIFIFV